MWPIELLTSFLNVYFMQNIRAYFSKSDNEAPENQSNIMSKSVWVQNETLPKHHHKRKFPYSMTGQDPRGYYWPRKPHVDYVRGKSMKQIGFLNRNLHAYSKTLKELSYKQFVLHSKSKRINLSTMGCFELQKL